MFFNELLIFILFIFINLIILATYFKNRNIAKKYILEITLVMTVIAITFISIFVFIDYPNINKKINTVQSNMIQSGGSKSRSRAKKKERFLGQSKQQKLQNLCGLPDTAETSHCFNDDTHHTCCMLGPNTQSGVGGTGNDIAEPARKAYMKKHNLTESQLKAKMRDEKISLPWCTCTGSSVCSQYDRTYGDSKIKFINNPKSSQGEIAENVTTNCEKYVKELYDIHTHGTPSVKPDYSKPDVKSCQRSLKTKKLKN